LLPKTKYIPFIHAQIGFS